MSTDLKVTSKQDLRKFYPSRPKSTLQTDTVQTDPSTDLIEVVAPPADSPTADVDASTSQPKRPRVEFDHNEIFGDPARRKQIEEYASEVRDQVRRQYLSNGPEIVSFSDICLEIEV